LHLINKILGSCVSVVFGPITPLTQLYKLRMYNNSPLSLFFITQKNLNFNSTQ